MGGSSSESEGEIKETESEKATNALPSVNNTNVDRPPRHRDPESASPPVDSHSERFRSRSPLPHRPGSPRGEKRRRADGTDPDRDRSDPRRFKVHYEEDRNYADSRRNRVSYADLDETDSRDNHLRHDERGTRRHRDKRRRTRSRSLERTVRSRGFGGKSRDAYSGDGRDGSYSRGHYDGHGDKDRGRRTREQSVSDRGDTPPTAHRDGHEAKLQHGAVQQDSDVSSKRNGIRSVKATSAIQSSGQAEQQAEPEHEPEPIDETAEIERRRALRRKRLSELQAKSQGSSAPATPNAEDVKSKVPSTVPTPRPLIETAAASARGTPSKLSPTTPREATPTTPAEFDLKDVDLANQSQPQDAATNDKDEPSAADYDPTVDMQEDKLKDEKRHHFEDVSAAKHNERQIGPQEIVVPAQTLSQPPKAKKPKADLDMFASDDEEDEEDEEDESVAQGQQKSSINGNVHVVQVPKGLSANLIDNWDDPEGYYRVILGELIDDRYAVQANLGKGMFSGVIRALDKKANKLVAIKVVRSNETMKKAGLKEAGILLELANADKEDKRHMIRLERHFEHRGHLCMVFENLSMNLREVIKKYGRENGINLKAVRSYAQQMFLGLMLLRKCDVLHADLKPDNVLVNEARSLLKICDLGSAAHLADFPENEPTPYLVSRFYRAPEIILGMPYEYGIDMWSIGCTLFELFTGKILFTGRNNNQMLRSMMDCRGRFPQKMLRKAQASLEAGPGIVDFPFDFALDNFKSLERERLTDREVVKWISLAKFPDRSNQRDLHSRLFKSAKSMSAAEKLELGEFHDLLDKCLQLNPEKRITPPDALKHPFIVKRAKIKP